MRGWYQRMTPEERRAWTARRDAEKVRARDRERYERDKAKRRAANRAHVAANRERETARRREWEMANPEKKRAHRAVAYAIKTGRLTRPRVCPGCGRDDTLIQAHHDDYSQPLKVRWLCPTCHAAAQKQ